MMQNRIIVFG